MGRMEVAGGMFRATTIGIAAAKVAAQRAVTVSGPKGINGSDADHLATFAPLTSLRTGGQKLISGLHSLGRATRRPTPEAGFD